MRIFFLLLILICVSCKRKDDSFKLNPEPGKVYNYLITKASSQEWTYQNTPHQNFDTTYLNIALQREKKDSIITYKLTFNKLQVIPHFFRMTFINTSIRNITQYNPNAILDSACGVLKGLSVLVDITEDGNVTQVRGIDQLMESISYGSKLEVNTVRRSLSDYVSENAVKDLLNRILSIPRNASVKVEDSWVKNIVLITKAPVKLSNMYTLQKLYADSAYLDIQSIVSTLITTKVIRFI